VESIVAIREKEQHKQKHVSSIFGVATLDFTYLDNSSDVNMQSQKLDLYSLYIAR
jgi:hypothetical protein